MSRDDGAGDDIVTSAASFVIEHKYLVKFIWLV